MPTTSENEIAEAVIRVAANTEDGFASFDLLYQEVPEHIGLTSDDLEESETRPGEPMWHQIVRNIQSHHETEGNAIYEGWLIHVPRRGYQVTDKGRKRAA